VLDVLNNDSGVAGLSGISNDNRTLWEAADAGSADAALALDVFAYRIAKSVGALAVALGGLDAVVFTGGIGEHSPETRRAVLARLGVFGLAEDAAANAANGRETAGRISAAGTVSALVVHTDEELLIARDTLELAQ
jgi:acetate kinase